MYLVIKSWRADGRPREVATLKTQAGAEARVAHVRDGLPEAQRAPAAFYVPHPGVPLQHVVVDPDAQTVSVDENGRLSEARADRLTALAAERWRRQVAGYVHPDDGVTYHADPEGRQSLHEAITIASMYEALQGDGAWSAAWKAQSGWTTMTLGKAEAVASGMSAMIQGLFATEKAKRDEIDALGDPAEIAAYDVTTGWPG